MKYRVPDNRVAELSEIDATMTAGTRLNFSFAEIAALANDLMDAKMEVQRIEAASKFGRYIPMKVTVTPHPSGLFEITGTQFVPEGQ